MIKEKFTQDKYIAHKKSISFLKANLVAIILPLPIVAIYVLISLFFIDERETITVRFELLDLLFFWLLIIISIILHELIHALFFLRSCENGRKSIKFGVKKLTPYCHCKEVMPISRYRTSCLAPLWLLCLPLAIISWISGNFWIFLVTIILIFGSGGDLWIVMMIRKYKKTAFVWDMVDEVGAIVYEPIPEEIDSK